MAIDIAPIFGNGSDGALTISSNASWGSYAPSVNVNGTAGNTYVTVTAGAEANFSAGNKVIIFQHRGTIGATDPNWEKNYVVSTSSGQVNLAIPLSLTYTDGADATINQAQMLKMPQYSTFQIDSGITLKPAIAGNYLGGVVAFCASIATIPGNLSAPSTYDHDFDNLFGFKGATGANGLGGGNNNQGDGYLAVPIAAGVANGNGGGGGSTDENRGGGGGGNATAGGRGGLDGGYGGEVIGNTALTSMNFGGGGGAPGSKADGTGHGGHGGPIYVIYARKLVVTGTISAPGGVGVKSGASTGSGGGGAGGSILIKALEADIGNNLISALGGDVSGGNGGVGGSGRIRIEACKLTGTTDQGSVSIVTGGYPWCGSIAAIL